MNAAASHINNREVMMADTWRGSSSIVGGYQIDISGYAYDTNGVSPWNVVLFVVVILFW